LHSYLSFGEVFTLKLLQNKMRAIVLAALLGTLAFADQRSLKQTLGQSKKLAQVEQAACDITPVEAEAPGLADLAVTEPTLAFCDCAT
jgi:hypothetical protein